MLSHDKDVQIRFDGILDEEFCAFWNSEAEVEVRAPRAEFRAGKKARGGLGFNLPPEVILAGQHVLEGASVAIGTALGRLLWQKLKKFFEKQDKSKIPSEISVAVKGKVKVLHPNAMPMDPPEDFLNIFADL